MPKMCSITILYHIFQRWIAGISVILKNYGDKNWVIDTETSSNHKYGEWRNIAIYINAEWALYRCFVKRHYFIHLSFFEVAKSKSTSASWLPLQNSFALSLLLFLCKVRLFHVLKMSVITRTFPIIRYRW